MFVIEISPIDNELRVWS